MFIIFLGSATEHRLHDRTLRNVGVLESTNRTDFRYFKNADGRILRLFNSEILGRDVAHETEL